MLSAHEVVNDMAARCVAAAIAEPLLAQVAHDDAVRLVYATVFARMIGELFAVVELLVVLLELELTEGLRGRYELGAVGRFRCDPIDLSRKLG